MGKRKKNPVESDGKVSKCIICESIYHWAHDCPDAYENKIAEHSTEDDDNEPVNLLIGYASDKEYR